MRYLYFSLFISILLCVSSCATTKTDWDAAIKENTQSAYETFLAKHQKSEFSRQAEERLNWIIAQETNNGEAMEAFLSRYPYGQFSDSATASLEKFLYESAVQKDTIKGYEDYLRRFPDSEFTPSIKGKLDENVLPKGCSKQHH